MEAGRRGGGQGERKEFRAVCDIRTSARRGPVFLFRYWKEKKGKKEVAVMVLLFLALDKKRKQHKRREKRERGPGARNSTNASPFNYCQEKKKRMVA